LAGTVAQRGSWRPLDSYTEGAYQNRLQAPMMNRHPTTRRGARARLALASVAALCLAAQLAGLAERVLERHEWCAVHGEWVHADQAAAGVGQRHAETRDPALAAIDGAPRAHDHCAVRQTGGRR
jgi:hypothetical protein